MSKPKGITVSKKNLEKVKIYLAKKHDTNIKSNNQKVTIGGRIS